MMIEDDIECDNNDDDALALTVTTALTTSCIVMQEHMDKRKHRQKKKKGQGHPFMISRQKNVNSSNLTVALRSLFQAQLPFFTE